MEAFRGSKQGPPSKFTDEHYSEADNAFFLYNPLHQTGSNMAGSAHHDNPYAPLSHFDGGYLRAGHGNHPYYQTGGSTTGKAHHDQYPPLYFNSHHLHGSGPYSQKADRMAGDAQQKVGVQRGNERDYERWLEQERQREEKERARRQGKDWGWS